MATVHLIDVENLAGRSRLNRGAARLVRHEYTRCVDVEECDVLVAGCGRGNVSSVAVAFEAGEIVGGVGGVGTEGADIALLDSAVRHIASGNFDTVVIGSGDHAFVEVVLLARECGMQVMCVSRRGCLASVVRLAVDRIVFVDELLFPIAA